MKKIEYLLLEEIEKRRFKIIIEELLERGILLLAEEGVIAKIRRKGKGILFYHQRASNLFVKIKILSKLEKVLVILDRIW